MNKIKIYEASKIMWNAINNEELIKKHEINRYDSADNMAKDHKHSK